MYNLCDPATGFNRDSFVKEFLIPQKPKYNKEIIQIIANILEYYKDVYKSLFTITDSVEAIKFKVFLRLDAFDLPPGVRVLFGRFV